MLARMWRAGRILASAFGLYIRPALLFLLFALYRLVISLGMILDHVFFPGIRQVSIERPLFIIGNPRSGTTLVHRFLADQQVGRAFLLWEILVPSLTLRCLVRPWIPALERLNPGRFHLGEVHQTSLTAAETDDLLVFLRFLDGVFYYIYFLAWDSAGHRDYLDSSKRPARLAPRHLRWLRACYRRQLYRCDRPRVLGKLFSFSLCAEQVLQVFPDARLVYLARDPVQALPSALSLVGGVVASVAGGRPPAPEPQQMLVRNLVLAARSLYAGFLASWQAGGIPPASVLVVRYDDLLTGFEHAMRDILEFAGHEPDAAMTKEIDQTADRQRRRRSAHRYSLAQFGLDEVDVRRDFGFVYEAFHIRLSPLTDGGPGTTPAPGCSS